MNKVREAINAGQAGFRAVNDKNRTKFYITLSASFAVVLVRLFYLYRSRNFIGSVVVVFVWLIFAPVFSWWWFRRTARGSS
jgi:hypothetical protein